MATPGSFLDGVIAAVIGIILTLILFYIVALPAEKFVAAMEDTDIYDLTGGWASSYDDIVFWMSLMYIVIVMPALVGVITMFLSAIKTQKYDVVTDEPEQIPSGAQYSYRYGREF